MNSQMPQEYEGARVQKRTEDPGPSQTPLSWNEIFARIDEAEIPADFLADRNQGVAEERPKL